MKSRPALVAMAIFWVAAILAACSSAPDAPPAEAYRGTMTSGCSPVDALSTVLRLESTKGPASASFDLWPASGMAPPATVEFDARHPNGQGTYCSAPDTCEPAEWGRVVLETPGRAGDLEGEWTLGLEDGRTVRGRFSAEWLAIQALCG